MKILTIISTFMFSVLFIFHGKSYAYLDPGTGSYLLQIFLATILGGAYVFRGYLGRVKETVVGVISKLLKGRKDNEKKG